MYFFYPKPNLRQQVVAAARKDTYKYLTAYNDGKCSLANITAYIPLFDENTGFPIVVSLVAEALFGGDTELVWAELDGTQVPVYMVALPQTGEEDQPTLYAVDASNSKQFLATLCKAFKRSPSFDPKYMNKLFQHWRRKDGFIGRDEWLKNIPCEFIETTWFDSRRGYV